MLYFGLGFLAGCCVIVVLGAIALGFVWLFVPPPDRWYNSRKKFRENG